MSEDGVLEFARALRAEVEEALSAGGGEPYSEPEFTRIVLERLADDGIVENPILLFQEGTFGSTKYKITGFSLAEDDERLVLVTTLFRDQWPPQAVPLDELRNAAERAVRFFRCSAKGLHEKIEPSNTEASDLARKLFEIQDRISFIRTFVLTDGLVGSRTLDDIQVDGTRVSYELFGLERLFRVLGQGHSREDIVIDLVHSAGYPLPCLPIPAMDGSYKGYLMALPGEVLADAYERYGTRLLELNVRAFLGIRGRKSVNAGLRATLKDESSQFFAYNNGIVATVDDLELDTTGDAPRISKLKGFQIVNGGQTTASIHRARRVDSVKLDAVLVPAKIVLIPKDDLSRMVGAISRSANKQNTVQPADFSANDPFHVQIEQLANNTWCPNGVGRWFYERARGSYGALEMKAALRTSEKNQFTKETPKERCFSKTDLAKYLNGWEGRPDQVSFGNQKNFQLFMQRLREERRQDATLDEAWYRRTIALTIVFRALLKIIRGEKFSAYQANIAAYTFTCLAWRTGGRLDFDLVWQRQAISPELGELLRDWSHQIDKLLRSTAGQRMPTEWAKRPEAWEAIRAVAPALQEPLPPELTAQGSAVGGSTSASRPAARTEGLSADDLAKIDEVRQVLPDTWLRVAAWGQKTKLIHFRLSGIARTMAEYGLAEWERSPSAKQAKYALEALNKFRAAGESLE